MITDSPFPFEVVVGGRGGGGGGGLRGGGRRQDRGRRLRRLVSLSKF